VVLQPVISFAVPVTKDSSSRAVRILWQAEYQIRLTEQWLRRFETIGRLTLLAMQYSPSLQVLNLLLIPRYFFTENVIEKRAPLSPNARRAGWVGCNIMLSRIPADGQIPVVINGVAADQAGIRERFAQAKALVQLSIPERGWTVDVLNGVRDLRRREFTLEEAYSLESHRALHLARVRVELLLNSGLPFRWLTVRVRLEVKLHVTEFAGPDKRNIPDSLDDPKVTLWHAPIVSHRALSRHLPRFSPASGPLRLPNRSISAIIDELLPQGMRGPMDA
jgi:hypothetical protein